MHCLHEINILLLTVYCLHTSRTIFVYSHHGNYEYVFTMGNTVVTVHMYLWNNTRIMYMFAMGTMRSHTVLVDKNRQVFRRDADEILFNYDFQII